MLEEQGWMSLDGSLVSICIKYITVGKAIDIDGS